MDVPSLLSHSQGPQSQGHCRALKSQVSESMNYENIARYRVFDPLDVRFDPLDVRLIFRIGWLVIVNKK